MIADFADLCFVDLCDVTAMGFVRLGLGLCGVCWCLLLRCCDSLDLVAICWLFPGLLSGG